MECFAEVNRNPQGRFVRTGTPIPHMRSDHITYILAEAKYVPVRSYSTPVAAIAPAHPHITGDSESGECRVHRSVHVKTAVAVSLQSCRLVAGQHDIPHIPIVIEHGVVVPRRHGSMLAGSAR